MKRMLCFSILFLFIYYLKSLKILKQFLKIRYNKKSNWRQLMTVRGYTKELKESIIN